MKTLPEKTATLFLTCLVALAITGYAYSHWTDTATIFGTAKMAHLEITIDDQKLIPDIGYTKNPTNKTITISAPITPAWQIWVGIIIKNKGTVPVTITQKITTTNQPYESYFGNETYFYGPYTTVPPEVWCDLNQTNPPPTGGKTPPIDLPVGDKLVVWQKIWLKNPLPTEFAGIIITSEYFATFSGWHDTVAVIYHLYKE